MAGEDVGDASVDSAFYSDDDEEERRRERKCDGGTRRRASSRGSRPLSVGAGVAQEEGRAGAGAVGGGGGGNAGVVQGEELAEAEGRPHREGPAVSHGSDERRPGSTR